ncbi:cadherin-related family member 5 [Scomber scombrus]|uniref:cadherin-related family member 5 n=1 Tax=Scomber scombrus TaxID=13677 RepID=UPI002DDB5C9F|nr:cadherin-related family member 5 [Scomber scombrus]
MDGIHPPFTVRTSISFLLLILLQTSADAQSICSAPQIVNFDENNAVGAVVLDITVLPGVTLTFKTPENPDTDNPFELNGNQLIAKRSLDYETQRTFTVNINCLQADTSFPLVFVVVLQNLNDNAPQFAENPYNVNFNEMSPVGTTVGRFAATDLDQPNQLYYTLTSDTNEFGLVSPTNPDIIVKTLLDFDKVKDFNLVLTVQDTPFAPVESPSFTATTTIMVTIVDVDNRPPWFQPCNKYEVGGAMVCQSSGYTAKVNLNEQEILQLKPGPIHAIDGDSLNEEITYSFLSGEQLDLFEINPNTGDVTMLRPTDVLGTITLTVLAAQKINTYQFATTSLTISVQVKSLHPPEFQKSRYEGVVSSVGTIAVDPTNKDEPLQIIAIDKDYAATGNINPYIKYSIKGSNDFSIMNGYLFMKKEVPDGQLSLQVEALDTDNDESATAELLVDVKTDATEYHLRRYETQREVTVSVFDALGMRTGLTTTSLPPNTTTEESTTISKTTEDIVSTTISKTTEDIVSTTISKTTEDIVSTTISKTTEDIVSTTVSKTTGDIVSTTDSITTVLPSTTTESITSTINNSGVFGVGDMAALGASLGVLLFVCLVVIGVLAHCIQKWKTDCRKISEASMFQRTLNQGSISKKGGNPYTNMAFLNEKDGGSTGSDNPDGGSIKADEEHLYDNSLVRESSAPVKSPEHDDSSLTGSENTNTDSEKEVKPILTKERRMEEGYKSVWFKEDIDPDAKEEVVIIPDSREDDSEEEDEDEDTDRPVKKVVFAEADLDSGLGVKIEDPAEDSDDDDMVTVDL